MIEASCESTGANLSQFVIGCSIVIVLGGSAGFAETHPPVTNVATTKIPQSKSDSARGKLEQLQKVEAEAEKYIHEHLFDPDGFMYSYVDVRTGKPFEESYVAHFKELERNAKKWSEHNRANRDPVTYWSYEDTIATAGYYMEGLILKYEVTGDEKALNEAFQIWDRYRHVYYASQIFGIGSFLRPYGGQTGGFAGMQRWMEPLGTDQAGPLLCGQYAVWKHAEGARKQELADIMVRTLTWYEQQGFRYLYYKTYIHPWNPGDHAGSYYLPAIAFAAKVTGDPKWKKLLDEKLPLVKGSGKQLMTTFKWGSDIKMLADIMGPDFERAFPPDLLAASYDEAIQHLAIFTEPGLTMPTGPGAHWHPSELGFYYLCGLAGMNYPGAVEKAADVLTAWKKVPEDFTVFLFVDNEKLPEASYWRLQSLAVGRPMVIWFKDYWALRKALQQAKSSTSTN